MALATIHWVEDWGDSRNQQLHDEDKEIALEAYWALRRREEGAVGIIKRVSLPKSWRPADYESAIYPEQPSSNLTNPGIAQSMYDAVPRNDR